MAMRYNYLIPATLLLGATQAFIPTPFLSKKSSLLSATLASSSSTVESGKTANTDELLLSIQGAQASSQEWTDMFGLSVSDRAFYALFEGIRKSITLGLRGKPFVISQADVVQALNLSDPSPFGGYFTMKDIAQAVDEDFLDAGRGSTDNRKGWKVRLTGTFARCKLRPITLFLKHSFNTFYFSSNTDDNGVRSTRPVL
jgi:hypothetical protein